MRYIIQRDVKRSDFIWNMKEMDNSFDLLSVAEVPASTAQLKKKWNIMERIQDRAKKGYSKKDKDLNAGKTMLLGKVK